ncbi:MAG: hypothetical protein LBI14_00975 [Treponema sp.]|jgi:hypothetical protein|nr:hypothetical protein [Treponema sp.]
MRRRKGDFSFFIYKSLTFLSEPIIFIYRNPLSNSRRKAMNKFLLIIALIVAFCSCQKQAQNKAEQRRAYIKLEIAEGKPFQEPVIMPDIVPQVNIIEPYIPVIVNQTIYSQEDIIGTWFMGNAFSSIEIKFTNDDILYIREFDLDDSLIDENFYPYKIEENKLIIDDADKSNNFEYYLNAYFLSSGAAISIDKLDARSLQFKASGVHFTFYKRTMEEVLERRNIESSYENKLKDFIHNEVLNGIIFQSDIDDENAVIAIYGEPIKDEIIDYSDGKRYEGQGYLTGIREISYEDFIHRYYVFSSGGQMYVDVVAKRNLDRFTMPIIGAYSEDIIAAFGSSYWRKDGEDLIYMWGGDGGESYRWVRFSIENDIVVSVAYILTSAALAVSPYLPSRA